jgi:hypothetical protein
MIEKLKLNLKEIGWKSVDWRRLSWDGGQWRALFEHHNKSSVLSSAGNFLTSRVTITQGGLGARELVIQLLALYNRDR